MVLHYFFRYPQADALDLFRSILRQVLELFMTLKRQLPPQKAEYLEQCFGADNRTPECNEMIEQLLAPLLGCFKKPSLCVDGIEDCSHDEQQKVWAGLSKLAQQSSVKLLVTGTDEIEIANALEPGRLQIRLDQGLNSQAIEQYIAERLRAFAERDQLLEDEGLRNWAQQELSKKSEGMYVLYASNFLPSRQD